MFEVLPRKYTCKAEKYDTKYNASDQSHFNIDRTPDDHSSNGNYSYPGKSGNDRIDQDIPKTCEF